MKIKSVLAVGAMGVGLGVAGLVGGTATASAACSDPTDPNPPPYTAPLTPARVACITNEQLGQFAESIDPARNIGILINGEDVDGEPSGLGLRDQLNGSTFASSVGDFLNGPRSPDGPSQPATP